MDCDLTLGDCRDRWSISNNAVKSRAVALGVELRRESSTCTVWPGEHLRLGDELHQHLQHPKATLANYEGPRLGSQADKDARDVRLSVLIESLPLSKSSVFEVIKALGVKTKKLPGERGQGGGRVGWLSPADAERVSDAAHRVNRGEARIADLRSPSITPPDGDCVLGINLASISMPKAISAMVEAWLDAQGIEGAPAQPALMEQPTPEPTAKAKRQGWKAATFYVKPETLAQLRRVVGLRKLEGQGGDLSDAVEAALQAWLRCEE